MVDGVRGLVFFDVGDGIGALEGGGRLGDRRVVVEAAECLYATSVGDAIVNILFTVLTSRGRRRPVSRALSSCDIL